MTVRRPQASGATGRSTIRKKCSPGLRLAFERAGARLALDDSCHEARPPTPTFQQLLLIPRQRCPVSKGKDYDLDATARATCQSKAQRKFQLRMQRASKAQRKFQLRMQRARLLGNGELVR